MQTSSSIHLSDVQAVYSGPEFDLWELLMGQQVHMGGLRSSERLADRAGIAQAALGIDLCCCTGAGMRALVRWYNVRRMIGVDATAAVIELGRQRCEREGWGDRIEFLVADACATNLPDACADFVWGEDAWCYVVDKAALIAEAARLVKPGGVIALTDWVAGTSGMSDAESQRLLQFMKFPNLQSLAGYAQLLLDNGCSVSLCEDTGQFAACVDLYVSLLRQQLTSDALRIVGFDRAMLQAIIGEMEFMRQMAEAGKIVQGRIVARKKAMDS